MLLQMLKAASDGSDPMYKELSFLEKQSTKMMAYTLYKLCGGKTE